MLGCDDVVRRISNGLGYLVDAVPAEVRESLPINQRPALLCAWWLLVTVSEQFASHGLAERAMPTDWQETPAGEAVTKATQVEHWQSRMAGEKRTEVLLAVPYMPASNYAAYGLHRVTAESQVRHLVEIGPETGKGAHALIIQPFWHRYQ